MTNNNENLEAAESTEDRIMLSIYNLGDEGNAWFVQGTVDEDIARGAVRRFLDDSLPEGDEFNEVYYVNLEQANTEVNERWFWVDTNNGNTMLQWLEGGIESPPLIEVFQGVRFFK